MPKWPEDYTNCYSQIDLDAAVAAEREACAAVADRHTSAYREKTGAMGDSMMKELAAVRAETASLLAIAIRTRK